jgi:hypothetical protein
MIITCKVNKGITLGCGEYSMAGLSEIYIGNFDELVSTASDVNEQITAITLDSTASTIYKFEFGEDTAFFTQPFINQNGNIAYNASIEFRIPNQNAEIIYTLKQIDFAKMFVIVRTRNDEFFMFGESNPLKRTGGENSSGTASTDAAGVSIVLTGGGPAPAKQVTEAAVLALI